MNINLTKKIKLLIKIIKMLTPIVKKQQLSRYDGDGILFLNMK